jgi:glycosyltransferase involved in cell wall biosynthesis
MPVYNAAAFVGEAIESILSQSYRDFEFLILDDGSSDNTLRVIRSFDDPRIRLVVHQQNRGLQASLNEGITLARYDLIARMDADDISHPWRLEKQVAYMTAHPECAMVDSWVKIMDGEKHFIRTEGIQSRFIYYSLTFECCIYHSAVMYRKKAVQSVGGYRLPYGEDYDLFWQLSRIYKIHTIEEALLWYRIHGANLNTVTKKTEYERYSWQLWRRNIAYYAEDKAEIPASWIACYRYDFTPLVEQGNLKMVYACLAYLDNLSKRILSVENPNRDADDIRHISHFKRQYIIHRLAAQLPFGKMWRLLLHDRQGKTALKETIKRGARLFSVPHRALRQTAKRL